VDVTATDVLVQPLPEAPEASIVPGSGAVFDNGFVYGFDSALTQQGSSRPWNDDKLGDYLRTSNNGVFRIDHSVKPSNRTLAGTGSTVVLWNEGESRNYGRWVMVVFGDVDGNFLVDLDDYAELNAMLDGRRAAKMQPGTPWRLAADVNRDGTVDENDLAFVYQAAIGKTVITQRMP
jgi:hypothetical protein